MFNNVSWLEIGFLVVLALFVFGPERLPKVAAEAGRMLRQLRRMAQGATSELRAELGPEMADLDLASLNPRRFVQRHLFEDDEDAGTAPARPSAPPLRAGERPPYDSDAT